MIKQPAEMIASISTMQGDPRRSALEHVQAIGGTP